MTDANDGADDPDDRPERRSPESEPIDDPADVPTHEPTEEAPMGPFEGASGADEPFGDVDVQDPDDAGDREFEGVSLGGASDDGGPASDGPLGDLAERMREKRDRDDVDPDDLFEEVDVGEVDEETLWQQVASDETFAVEEPVDREDVVEKSAYCEKCEFFTGPPRVRCTHEGSTILEMTDLEHFRVRNCPVVLEEEALESIND